ncbi:MAG: hypothetical protein ABIP23_14880 [Pelobium sp.]
MSVKKYIRVFLALGIMFSMLSAMVPLHNIVHTHYFVKADSCGFHCEKHIKNYSKPCCTTSDAVFLATIPKIKLNFNLFRVHEKIYRIEATQNYFQFFHFSKNKAPPVNC